MDCRTALEILDCWGPNDSGIAEAEVAAARRHMAGCPRCVGTVRNRRKLDRKIGRVMRSVEVPPGGLQLLLGKIADLERNAGSIQPADGALAVSANGSFVSNDTPVLTEVIALSESSALNGAHGASTSQGVTLDRLGPAIVSRRRLWRSMMLAAACLVVAAVGFFSVVWLLTPKLSVEDVRAELAKIEPGSLSGLPGFKGDEIAAVLPADAAWQNLEWYCGGVAKGPTFNPRAFGIYGFVIRDKQRRESISGFLAVVPRRRVRSAPAASTLSASPAEYVSARMGESVCVAWTSGDVICVCMVQGGADSLVRLQRLLDVPAA